MRLKPIFIHILRCLPSVCFSLSAVKGWIQSWIYTFSGLPPDITSLSVSTNGSAPFPKAICGWTKDWKFSSFKKSLDDSCYSMRFEIFLFSSFSPHILCIYIYMFFKIFFIAYSSFKAGPRPNCNTLIIFNTFSKKTKHTCNISVWSFSEAEILAGSTPRRVTRKTRVWTNQRSSFEKRVGGVCRKPLVTC